MIKDYKWREVRDLTLCIMIFTFIHIVGFMAGLIYQPLEYVRNDMPEDKFTDIKNAPRANELVIEEEDEEEDIDDEDDE